jgi:hypothetical protein
VTARDDCEHDWRHRMWFFDGRETYSRCELCDLVTLQLERAILESVPIFARSEYPAWFLAWDDGVRH